MNNLTNLQSGHYSSDVGIKSSHEIEGIYNAAAFETDEDVLLININKFFTGDQTQEELYEVTRSCWVIGDRRNKAK